MKKVFVSDVEVGCDYVVFIGYVDALEFAKKPFKAGDKIHVK